MNIYRHGDVLITPIQSIPNGVKRKKDAILAYGEATGHNHQLVLTDAQFKEQLDVYINKLTQKIYFENNQPVELKHQEHKTITIQPGIYQVDIEREYDYFTKNINTVID